MWQKQKYSESGKLNLDTQWARVKGPIGVK